MFIFLSFIYLFSVYIEPYIANSKYSTIITLTFNIIMRLEIAVMKTHILNKFYLRSINLLLINYKDCHRN